MSGANEAGYDKLVFDEVAFADLGLRLSWGRETGNENGRHQAENPPAGHG
jgi:hypothetical protein